MKTLALSLLLTLPAPLFATTSPSTPTPAPAPAPVAPPLQAEKLNAAIKIGRAWQDHLLKGEIAEGQALWGYSDFAKASKEDFRKALATHGALRSTALEEDRCLVDLQGNAAGTSGTGRDTYITLRWFSQYEKGMRRESLVLHDAAEKSQGLKIIGLRREELATGRQAGFELAAALGQLALLKLHGAPPARWEAYEREARAYATQLGITLPPVPDSPSGPDSDAPVKLIKFLMEELPPLMDKLGDNGGAGEARLALNAFALLMMYVPGEEIATRLAALAGTQAEKSKVPPNLWKPVIEATVKKAPMGELQEAVQVLVAGVSDHLSREKAATEVKSGTRETMDMAFRNMTQMTSYVVHAELTAQDARKSTMDASMGIGSMDLTFVGFDGVRQRHVVTPKGFFLSRDDGATWMRNPDEETGPGLCRTLQAPVDTAAKITEKYTFELAGTDKVDGEDLYRFRGTPTTAGEPLRTYWMLPSKAGPVIRRVRLTLNFGTLTADTLIIYSKLGKPVEIQEPRVGGN